jgi:hypothetical protein
MLKPTPSSRMNTGSTTSCSTSHPLLDGMRGDTAGAAAAA